MCARAVYFCALRPPGKGRKWKINNLVAFLFLFFLDSARVQELISVRSGRFYPYNNRRITNSSSSYNEITIAKDLYVISGGDSLQIGALKSHLLIHAVLFYLDPHQQQTAVVPVLCLLYIRFTMATHSTEAYHQLTEDQVKQSSNLETQEDANQHLNSALESLSGSAKDSESEKSRML